MTRHVRTKSERGLAKGLTAGILLLLMAAAACSRREAVVTRFPLEEALRILHDEQDPRVLVTAHRMRHTKYPENSLAAVLHSVEGGADIIEVDVRTTRDGRMVLMHDSDIERTANGKGKVKDLTWEELQQVTLKSRLDDTLTFHVPLLEEVLQAAKGKIIVDLDMKDVYVKPLVELVKRTGTGRQVIFFDSDTAVLDSVLQVDSTLMIMPRAHDPQELKTLLERYDAPVVHIDESFFTEEVVKAIRRDGARVWINALGKPDVMAAAGILTGYRNLVTGGAGIIQTDRPVQMNMFLTKEGKR